MKSLLDMYGGKRNQGHVSKIKPRDLLLIILYILYLHFSLLLYNVFIFLVYIVYIDIFRHFITIKQEIKYGISCLFKRLLLTTYDDWQKIINVRTHILNKKKLREIAKAEFK